MNRLRIGMVGTFDVENFGDLLFPLLGRHELEQRLDSPELVLYSYHDEAESSWPYAVRSLVHLPTDVEGLDLLVVGGGHLVRFDKNVAPGYEAPRGIHHPTGYWLAPTLLAACYGVPVAWNALSTSLDTPAWAQGVLRTALHSAAYVSVRDQPSIRELSRIAPEITVALVPDTAFGIRSLLPSEASAEFLHFRRSVGLAGPYVVVQPSPHLVPHARQIDEALRAASASGHLILELPVSPCLGDHVGALDLATPTVRASRWPGPLLLVEIVSNAEAVIARSLHLSIVALACGVPVHRHASAPDPKYKGLDDLPGVVWWDDTTNGAEQIHRSIGRGDPGAEIELQRERLAAHWDAIANLPERPAPRRAEVTAALIAQCTTELEALAPARPESRSSFDGAPPGADGSSGEASSQSDGRGFGGRLRSRFARSRLPPGHPAGPGDGPAEAVSRRSSQDR